MPNLFSDGMVLQRDAAAPLWGKAAPGTEVTVTVSGGENHQTHTTTAAVDGRWRVVLDPLTTGEPLTILVDGDGQIELTDVLVGEVWVCSGQSNMQFSVGGAMNGDIELLVADHPSIRLLTVDNYGSEEPLYDFEGSWERCTPENAQRFSAVGYYFARRLQGTLGVPVGLIDNAWGGSAAEAWTPRRIVEADPAFANRLDEWRQKDREGDDAGAKAWFEQAFSDWERRSTKLRQEGRQPEERPLPSSIWSMGNARPGNLYEARIAPIAGYAVRGVLWYQGESNAWRPEEYRELFPLLIQSWRDAWNQEKLSFYWVQLAAYLERQEGSFDSSWARLREAQTLTLDRLSDTGQAVIIDLGASDDVHPRNKHEVANRLARIALAKNYGYDLDYESPRLVDHKIVEDKVVVTLSPIGNGLQTVDGDAGDPIVGFAIRGSDRTWRAAFARHLGNGRIEVWHPYVTEPLAVRYAWGDNPECNLYTEKGILPVTPFRTDTWEIWR